MRLHENQCGPTTARSRLATSRFFNHILPAKLVLVEACRADPQAADAEALGVNHSTFG